MSFSWKESEKCGRRLSSLSVARFSGMGWNGLDWVAWAGDVNKEKRDLGGEETRLEKGVLTF